MGWRHAVCGAGYHDGVISTGAFRVGAASRLPPEPQLHAGTARPAFHDTASEIGQARRVAVAAGTKPTVREPSLNEAYVLQPRFGHS